MPKAKTKSRSMTKQSRALESAVERAGQAAVRDALILHKKLGHPIAVWENGQVRWIPADEIVIPELPPATE